MDKVIDSILNGVFNKIETAMFDFLIGVVNVVLTAITTPLTVPFIWDLIVYFTIISVVVVILLRVCIGIKDGLFANGSNTEISAGEFFFKTVLSLVLVVTAGPLTFWFIDLTSRFSQDMMSYSFGATTGTQVQLDLASDMKGFFQATGIWAGPFELIAAILVVIVIFQVGKRWVTLFLATAVAPLVAIHTAVSDSSNYSGLLKEIVGLGVINGIQILLLNFSIACLHSGGMMTGSSFSPLFWFFLMGATASIPAFMQRYALPSGSGGGRTGVYVAMMGVRTVSSIGKMAR